jgi:hypothetical protein
LHRLGSCEPAAPGRSIPPAYWAERSQLRRIALAVRQTFTACQIPAMTMAGPAVTNPIPIQYPASSILVAWQQFRCY